MSRATSLLLAVLLLASSGCQDRQVTGNGPTPIEIRLPWVKNPEYAFLFLAQQPNGEFQKYRLEAEITGDRGSNTVISAFDAGSAEFGFVSGDSLVMARQRGVQVQALFVLYPSSPAVVVSLAERQINKVEDLLGKNIGVISQSTTYPQFKAMLRHAFPNDEPEAGVDYFETEAVAGGLTQLERGHIDALTHYTNFAPVQLEDIGLPANEIFMRDHGIEIYSTVFAATDRVIRDEPELVQRVVNALLESLNRAITNPDLALQALRQEDDYSAMGTDTYVEAAMLAAHNLITERGDQVPVGTMDKDGWYRTERTLLQTGQVADDIDDSFYYEDRFLREYLRRTQE